MALNLIKESMFQCILSQLLSKLFLASKTCKQEGKQCLGRILNQARKKQEKLPKEVMQKLLENLKHANHVILETVIQEIVQAKQTLVQEIAQETVNSFNKKDMLIFAYLFFRVG